MKYYILGVIDVLLFSVSFGFVLPALISAPSDTAVLIGIGYLIFLIPVLWYLNKSTVKKLIAYIEQLQ